MCKKEKILIPDRGMDIDCPEALRRHDVVLLRLINKIHDRSIVCSRRRTNLEILKKVKNKICVQTCIGKPLNSGGSYRLGNTMAYKKKGHNRV
jgi:hypothetical protein